MLPGWPPNGSDLLCPIPFPFPLGHDRHRLSAFLMERKIQHTHPDSSSLMTEAPFESARNGPSLPGRAQGLPFSGSSTEELARPRILRYRIRVFPFQRLGSQSPERRSAGFLPGPTRAEGRGLQEGGVFVVGAATRGPRSPSTLRPGTQRGCRGGTPATSPSASRASRYGTSELPHSNHSRYRRWKTAVVASGRGPVTKDNHAAKGARNVRPGVSGEGFRPSSGQGRP